MGVAGTSAGTTGRSRYCVAGFAHIMNKTSGRENRHQQDLHDQALITAILDMYYQEYLYYL